MTLTKATLPILVAGMLGILSPTVHAFADDDARRAILELREQIKGLQEQLQVQQNGQLTFIDKLNALQEQNRYLTGRVEELTNSLSQEQRNTRDLFANLDTRLQKFEPVNVVINGQSFSVKPEEKASYEEAVQLLQEGQYQKASMKFSRFVRNWDASPYRPDALYWLGSTYFALERYKETIEIQNQLIREYSKDVRVPDAMISVAAAQASLGNIKAAQATLQKVIKNYPQSEGATIAKERLDSLTKKKTTK